MFMLAVPHVSSNLKEGNLGMLHQILLEQQEDLTMLCTIVEYLKGELQTGIDNQEVRKYNEKVTTVCTRQTKRYEEIDNRINTTIILNKKGRATDDKILIYGREVRKLESGLRTLRLFVSDAITMLDKNHLTENRSEERIRYFEKRSVSLQVEMITLNKQLSLL
ncbi:MAG: chemotaxis protein [Solibacillus sp.]|uniref:chemotaxis protein n=1 Tax=unclassified Solibacillus TaxID=2637870 RepID=UPI0030F70461